MIENGYDLTAKIIFKHTTVFLKAIYESLESRGPHKMQWWARFGPQALS